MRLGEGGNPSPPADEDETLQKQKSTSWVFISDAEALLLACYFVRGLPYVCRLGRRWNNYLSLQPLLILTRSPAKTNFYNCDKTTKKEQLERTNKDSSQEKT